MTKAIAIVNPASANGRTARNWRRHQLRCNSAGLAVETRYTEAPRHAIELTQLALEQGCRHIIVVGGDGTVNEVVNGFFRGQDMIASEARLSIVAAGTGCDFIKSLGIPKDPTEAIRLILKGETRRLDVGRCQYRDRSGQAAQRYFLNIAEAGIGGAIVDRVNQTTKLFGGFASFLAGTLRTFATYRNLPTTITIDHSQVIDLTTNNIVIANGQFFGGGMRVAPQAQTDDGRFDVIVMGDLSKKELFGNVQKIYDGTHLAHPKIQVFQARHVAVTSSHLIQVEMDGEYLGSTPAEFEILPKCLNVTAPIA